jgi:hypothetical protein
MRADDAHNRKDYVGVDGGSVHCLSGDAAEVARLWIPFVACFNRNARAGTRALTRLTVRYPDMAGLVNSPARAVEGDAGGGCALSEELDLQHPDARDEMDGTST